MVKKNILKRSCELHRAPPFRKGEKALQVPEEAARAGTMIPDLLLL
jgi:hypothetical protein